MKANSSSVEKPQRFPLKSKLLFRAEVSRRGRWTKRLNLYVTKLTPTWTREAPTREYASCWIHTIPNTIAKHEWSCQLSASAFVLPENAEFMNSANCLIEHWMGAGAIVLMRCLNSSFGTTSFYLLLLFIENNVPLSPKTSTNPHSQTIHVVLNP